MKPLIGITTASRLSPQGWEFLSAFGMNVRAIERAGGLPVLIPHILDETNLRDLYQRVDAILLPGGGDISPETYGQEAHPKTDFVDLARDRTEIKLAQWAAEEDRPLFGICRGHQIVNVALGGTLIQDIPSLAQTDLLHFPPLDVPRNHLPHSVQIEEKSKLHSIVNQLQLEVNSLHHQAVDRLAEPLRITAHAPDGIVEATEYPGKFFYHTVQWHPEDLTSIEVMQKLFDALVEAARSRVKLPA